MSKKFWLVTGGSVLTVFAGIAVTVFTLTQIGNDTTPNQSQAKVPETFLKAQQEPKGEVTYTDASGFSFKHPSNVKVADTTPSDQSYYTQVTLSKDVSAIVIAVRDSNKNLDYPDIVGATTLGGLPATQYTADDRLITVSYDQGVLYTVNAPAKDVYMSKVYEIVVSTFSFANANASSGSDPNSIYEEETIE